jgi:hypothetical protein
MWDLMLYIFKELNKCIYRVGVGKEGLIMQIVIKKNHLGTLFFCLLLQDNMARTTQWVYPYFEKSDFVFTNTKDAYL